MRTIPEQLGSKCAESIKVKVFAQSYDLELDMYITTCRFEKAAYLISSIEKGMEQFKGKMDRQHEIVFYGNFACLYFIQCEYKKALSWNNKILNDIDANIREDIYCSARIFNLIIHYELDNEGLLEYLEKPTHRYLDKRQKLYKVETSILDFIRKKLPKAISQKELMGAFKELKIEIEEITNDPFEKQALEYFDFISWIESKIENRPFAEIVRSRHRTDSAF